MMYIPKSFENKNLDQLHQIIEKFNFATLISTINDEVTISHVPVMLSREQGPYGTLHWHVANLNPHSTKFDGNNRALFIFHGPHYYISPTWYNHSPSVPTWNYIAVHVHGIPKATDQNELLDDLTNMMKYHESTLNQKDEYTLSDDYKRKSLEHISGFKMEITQIEGKFKLGQNRDSSDQIGMLKGLRKQDTPDAIALADFIEHLHKQTRGK